MDKSNRQTEKTTANSNSFKKVEESGSSKSRSNKKRNKKYRIQWHPAFVAAMKLELKDYREHLYFESEHVLSKAPLAADLLLIVKDDIEMDGYDWGNFFKRHNLFEYKGVGAPLDWRAFSKGVAYAYLYTSQGSMDDNRGWEKLTLTFLRQAKPEKLLSYLKKSDFSVENREDGVYHIHRGMPFKVQIIVLKEVSFDRHPWLSVLTDRLSEEQVRKLIEQEKTLREREDRDNAEAVMEVVAKANQKVFDRTRGDDVKMGEALMELMKPEIDALLAKKDAEIAQKVAEKVAEKDAEIKKLKEQIKKLQGNAT